MVRAAVEVLQPTGVPFLDLCIWKGRFPSVRRRFCTEQLKVFPIEEQCRLGAGPRGWAGRALAGRAAAESPRRAGLPRVQSIRGWKHCQTLFRPILDWSAG